MKYFIDTPIAKWSRQKAFARDGVARNYMHRIICKQVYGKSFDLSSTYTAHVLLGR